MVSETPDLQNKDQGMKTTVSIPEEEDNLNIFIQKQPQYVAVFSTTQNHQISCY